MSLDPAELRREIEHKRSATPKTVGQLLDRHFVRLSLEQAEAAAGALEERDRLRAAAKQVWSGRKPCSCSPDRYAVSRAWLIDLKDLADV